MLIRKKTPDNKPKEYILQGQKISTESQGHIKRGMKGSEMNVALLVQMKQNDGSFVFFTVK